MRKLLLTWVAFSCTICVLVAQTSISSSVQVHPGGKLAEYNTLAFVSGILITPRHDPAANISWQPGAGHVSASDSSHVHG